MEVYERDEPFPIPHKHVMVQDFLDQITLGVYDDDLEAILAAAHGRKRAKRGVRNARGLGRV